MKNPDIKRMTLSDLPEVIVIERASYHEPWTEAIFKDCLATRYECRVLREKKAMLGYFMFSCVLDEAHLLNIAVHPDHRSKGHARFMMNSLINELKRFKINALYLEVNRNNPGAIAIYESLGFKQIGLRKGYYSVRHGREDALVYRLDIRV